MPCVQSYRFFLCKCINFGDSEHFFVVCSRASDLLEMPERKRLIYSKTPPLPRWNAPHLVKYKLSVRLLPKSMLSAKRKFVIDSSHVNFALRPLQQRNNSNDDERKKKPEIVFMKRDRRKMSHFRLTLLNGFSRRRVGIWNFTMAPAQLLRNLQRNGVFRFTASIDALGVPVHVEVLAGIRFARPTFAVGFSFDRGSFGRLAEKLSGIDVDFLDKFGVDLEVVRILCSNTFCFSTLNTNPSQLCQSLKIFVNISHGNNESSKWKDVPGFLLSLLRHSIVFISVLVWFSCNRIMQRNTIICWLLHFTVYF